MYGLKCLIQSRRTLKIHLSQHAPELSRMYSLCGPNLVYVQTDFVTQVCTSSGMGAIDAMESIILEFRR